MPLTFANWLIFLLFPTSKLHEQAIGGQKSKIIQQNKSSANGQWSRKLTNLDKKFFLQLATNAIEDVNRLIVFDNMSYARKAMIRCNLALG